VGALDGAAEGEGVTESPQPATDAATKAKDVAIK
jgi:hypothetical protein